MRHAVLASLILLATGATAAAEPAQRSLTFEGRVKAQEAIERVYYSYQIGATKPFEQAVPTADLENKVHKYLDETAALSVYWKTAVTDEMLQRELERMAHGTRMPERLTELYAALGSDPFLVKECLARPALVDRLTHNFYAFDQALHKTERAFAESIHAQLVSGVLGPTAEHPNRTVVEIGGGANDAGLPTGLKASPQALTATEFKLHRIEYPAAVGQVSDVQESREAFSLSVVLSETSTNLRVASYVIRKTPWKAWWASVRQTVAATPVASVATGLAGLPALRPGASHTACISDDTWLDAMSSAPARRSDHVAVWTGTLMVVWGGTSGTQGFVPTGARYDPAIDSWTSMSDANTPVCAFPRAVWTGTKMIVWCDPNGTLDSSGGRYDPATDTWTAVSGVNAPSHSYASSVVWTGTVMVVWGGYDNSTNVPVKTGGRYDPSTDTWLTTATNGAPSRRGGVAAVWTRDTMVVWGGYDGSALRNDGGRYDPATDQWAPVSTSGAPTGRVAEAVVWTGSKMAIWGGIGDVVHLGLVGDGKLYDPVADHWTSMSTIGAPAARYLHTAVWTGRHMIVWGGHVGSGPLPWVNDGARYDPSNDSWTPTSMSGAPSPRESHTAVWSGTQILVFGGSDGDGDIRTGGRYDPNSDSWTPTAVAYGPEAAAGHTAVWTGNLMVVWGGLDARYSYAVLSNTNGRYDPVTDSWAPMSTADEPATRFGHTAVWTGEDMVVWGGYCRNDRCRAYPYGQGTGGRYDPISDSWTPTSIAGAPYARAGQLSVWTGSRMLIWSGDPYDKSGGQYDPRNDSWTPTSTVGAPDGRQSATAVWTGSRMLVWGGQGPGGDLNTGGRYDPSTDSWTPISTEQAPETREGHVAVWTGSRMVVWGGCDPSDYPSSYRSTGGRYDPANDSWAPTSTDGAPSPRLWATAIWTGQRMVVWGGSSEDYPNELDTGGRYDPVGDSWAPTSILGAPSPRFSHTAVWTRSGMLIWGGRGYVPMSLETGARYVLGTGTDDDGDGFSECQGDCDDTNPNVYTNAPQLCDGVNNDCKDPAWPTLPPDEVDADGDRVSICRGDCDDTNPSVHPGATERCNGVDDNCNGVVDEGATCDDGNPCTDDKCDAGVGCVFTNTTTPCDDHDVCTIGDTCLGGACAPGAGTIDCNDHNPCTNDSCNPALGCVHANNTAPCDDGVLCTSSDTCGGGACHGMAIVCNDNNTCTDDSCNQATGTCSFANDDANTCSDGNPCTQTDTCHAGLCSGSNPVQCNGSCPPGFTRVGGLCQKSYDIGLSLLDNLGTYCDGSGTNRYNNCSNLNYGFHWADLGGSFSGVTRLDVKLESGISCSDTFSTVRLNGLVVGSFHPLGSCTCFSGHGTISMPNVATGAYVVGGVNTISISPSGTCEGLSKSVNLSNNFARITVTYLPHDSACQIGTCAPATGACNFSNVPEGTGCDDGNACTNGDACSGGSCIAGTPIACSDGNVCTDDACSPTTGCVYTNNTNPCDDGNDCTTGDTCSGGTCNPGMVSRPSEIVGLLVHGQSGTTLTWTALGGNVVYDIAASTISDMHFGGTATATCLSNDLVGARYADGRANPDVGDGYYYLIRAQSACGSGSYGVDSAGRETMPTGACP